MFLADHLFRYFANYFFFDCDFCFILYRLACHDMFWQYLYLAVLLSIYNFSFMCIDIFPTVIWLIFFKHVDQSEQESH